MAVTRTWSCHVQILPILVGPGLQAGCGAWVLLGFEQCLGALNGEELQGKESLV